MARHTKTDFLLTLDTKEIPKDIPDIDDVITSYIHPTDTPVRET